MGCGAASDSRYNLHIECSAVFFFSLQGMVLCFSAMGDEREDFRSLCAPDVDDDETRGDVLYCVRYMFGGSPVLKACNIFSQSSLFLFAIG